MDVPKISIIVPVYKAERYLRKCLDSIVNQTYQNLEIILVDDGSPDNCGTICDEYAAKDLRIIVIHQENAGVSAARNAGLDIASGEYIGFVDSDDYVAPDMYEHLLQLIVRDHADIAQCGIVFEKRNKKWTEACPPKAFCSVCGETGFPGDTWVWYMNSIWNKLYKAELAMRIAFNTALTYGEDLLYNAQLLPFANAITFSSQAKYTYVQQEESLSHSISMQRRYDSVINMLEENLADIHTETRGHSFMRRAQFLIVADFAMQVARFCNENQTFKASVRKYARAFEKESPETLCLTKGERLKMLLISRAWWLYRPLILLRYHFKT